VDAENFTGLVGKFISRDTRLTATDTCNVSFYLEMDSDYVISKSEDHLVPLFLHFCKKYDICNLSRGALTGAFGKVYETSRF